MASLIEMPATNPASLTSVPAPHTVEGENCHKLPSLTSEHAHTHATCQFTTPSVEFIA